MLQDFKSILFFLFCVFFVPSCLFAQESTYGRPNLALNGTIIASSAATSGYVADNVKDGLISTPFYSHQQINGKFYCEFVIDLAESYPISKIDLYVLQTRGFEIFISNDNINWNSVKTQEWNASVGTALSIPFSTPIEGRYVKYYGWASWNQWVGVSEIGIFVSGSVPPTSPPGSLQTTNIAVNSQVEQLIGTSETNYPPENVLDSDIDTSCDQFQFQVLI